MRPEGRGGRTPYGNGMQPTLTWVDLTASDRDKMRRVLDLFNEQGTLDEMGDVVHPDAATLRAVRSMDLPALG